MPASMNVLTGDRGSMGIFQRAKLKAKKVARRSHQASAAPLGVQVSAHPARALFHPHAF